MTSTLRGTCLALLALTGLSLLPGAARADDAVGGRVIVKFRSSSALKQIAAAGRVQSLAQRLGVTATLIGQPAPELHVMHARGISTAALAARLAQESDVEFAVPDRLKQAAALPNDPLFSAQWMLQTPDTTHPAAIDAVGAWTLSAGSSGVVVAVVDTGVRLDHEDLMSRLLPGYDFISDDLNAGDGQPGRDADPTDPGDFVSSADLANSAFTQLCPGVSRASSSWHGTQIAGIVAAEANNSLGIAGVAGATRVLPVRALGKCGGFDSDIIAGMRWAAGLSVPGVPANTHPARVINLSLAGSGSCSAAYASAIAEIRAAGTLIVAAAGNETGPVEEPANCAGVLAVAGVRHVGTKVGYSSFGAEVGLSAPAGNCVNTATGSPCLFPFVNATNLGSTVPAANGYTGLTAQTVGTSFATPLVAGTAALMIAAHPGLGVTALGERLRASATAFPSDASLAACPTTTADGQCNCTTATCGAGMLNAKAAVQAAQAPEAAVAVSATPVAGSAVTLSAAASTTAPGATLVAWQWTQTAGPASAAFSNAAAASTSFNAPQAGTYSLRLTVTDDAGRQGSVDTTLDVQAPPPPAGGGGGGGAVDGPLLALLGAAASLAIAARRGVRRP
ncbi:MAG TPA: S8 family peptidase [Rhodocyclaceae bacterium]|nr:S8 family peptidase [Rhodocyclaceae bacterium]